MGKNIVLTGFMGAGKTSTGRRLAKRLGLRFVDTDDLIVEQTGLSVREIFEHHGEAEFRRLEREAVARISMETGLVISTGGGVVLSEENMANLRRNGVIIHLAASPAVIMQRTEGKNDRPLLETDDRERKIKELLEFRRPYYERADMSIDTSELEGREVVSRIVKYLKKAEG